ncbi:hypothetical protein LJC07_02250 [Christensenellaceae bacterium OttesenSCG-928-L17]|nr:hypothetical protein [Christensenellaceae bacterium OttesenSCG-928-L17]
MEHSREQMRYCKLEIFVPVTHLEEIRQALFYAGAGQSEHYDSVMSYHPVTGCFRPLSGANPYTGTAGVHTQVEEYKVEARCTLASCAAVVRALRAAHPYEEPVINILPLMALEE